MRKCLLKACGFTLAEVIISIAVLGMVIAPIMTLFVMSARLNIESSREYKSFLAAQKYMEEIKAMDEIELSGYIYDSDDGCYKRIVAQSGEDYGAVIIIEPERDFLYSIEVYITYEGEVVNSLIGSKLIYY
ncbi:MULTISPECIES: type IV pilus modification PilV family protein [unclassified Sedimentibacter]|uniref:type IV pilus modification PilV family protein n=1 Tax=unclassified Sedimentibacter TaxID=2649220 RepID=UPI0027E10339|nr:type II secretion system protein [Sedimentibacter sp. MB35-C1]WMJ76664.1 type II secretion system protein [Sedimentibacter sp. MB35-C1]